MEDEQMEMESEGEEEEIGRVGGKGGEEREDRGRSSRWKGRRRR